MKVLKRNLWEEKTSCLGCKSLLLLNEADIHDDYSQFSDSNHPRATPYYFICCVCGTNNPLGPIPAHVQEAVRYPRDIIK